MTYSTFHFDLDRGFAKPIRYVRGTAMNVWASKVNECAARLDSMDLPPEAVAVLRDLFEEIGQQARDAMGLVS